MAKVSIIAKTNRKLKDGYPICIRLAVKKYPANYIRIDGLFINDKKEWSKSISRFTRKKSGYKELNKILNEIEDKIDNIVAYLSSTNTFSYQAFRDKYFDKDKIDNSVFNAFEKRISRLYEIKRTSTATYYKDCLRALKRYTKDITFEQINYKFIEGYKNHLAKRGIKINGIAAYLRGLRAVHFEYAKENDLPLPTTYRKSSIKTERTKNRALTHEQFNLLQKYKPTVTEEKYLDFFFISYYLHGANLTDIGKLTQENIVNNRVEYKRSKTGTLYSIPITKQTQFYLDKYKVKECNYLFPIIKNSSSKGYINAVKFFTRNLNRNLKIIAGKLNIPAFTFYYARYTFVSFLMDKDVPIQYIQQLMGHQNISTTQVYMKKYSNKKLDEMANKIYEPSI